ncbi:MAG: hypothetical protein FD126_1353 [Elusimicrobia bacterium]|nr:MAG: hypothetical protein FD126_1353 [Elusimicrobiota bacterium]
MTRPSLLVVLCLALTTAARGSSQDPGAVDAAGSNEQMRAQAQAGCATAPPGEDVAWDDPCHQEFFNYQRYLTRNNMPAETREGWAAAKKEERLENLAKGEAFLKKRFEELMAKTWFTPVEEQFVEAVWGQAVGAKLQTLAKARDIKDPEQIRLALEGIKGLTGKLGGGVKVDWKRLFDGGGASGDIEGGPRFDSGKDYLKPDSEAQGFLASLEAPEVKAALASRKAYSEYLVRKGVPPQALPTFQAMYDVLTRAPEAERKEMAHLLPTTVRFLADGKTVGLGDLDGALGVAKPGPYDRPEAVVLSKAIGAADPLVAAKTLAHEFQHIYDMYAGRYYTLDSEMRGFKVAALYFRSLKAASPERYAQLLNHDDAQVRGIVSGAEEYAEALDKSPSAFADAVAFGYGYQKRSEGVFQGRVSLREAVEPTFGLPRELAAVREMRGRAKAEVEALEKRQASVRKAREQTPSRELDKQLEKLATDLAGARSAFNSYDSQTTIKEIRLRRMQSEVQWLDARSKGATKDPYDLHLPVDADYVTP